MLKASLLEKLDTLCERHEELSALLCDGDVIANTSQFTKYAKEHAQLQMLVDTYTAYQTALQTIADSKVLLQESDPELKAMAQEEQNQAQLQQKELEQELLVLLLPRDPDDGRNVYLEIRAGTGGDEAAIFVGDLFRMYGRYAERMKWQVEVVSANESEQGGYKEVIARISGEDVYSKLKFESGAHRVQRVPETESQGRVHTSAVTVAILPEVEEVDAIDVNTDEIRVDTFRASGAGGQHVNKTDSAIRITHMPSGIVVECQDERSQHKNRAKAMALLQSKLLSQAQQSQRDEQAQSRRLQVGTGDRSERIRTYNYPQGRITDHRINLTLYKLGEVMEGNLDQVVSPLLTEHQADLLTAMGFDKDDE